MTGGGAAFHANASPPLPSPVFSCAPSNRQSAKGLPVNFLLQGLIRYYLAARDNMNFSSVWSSLEGRNLPSGWCGCRARAPPHSHIHTDNTQSKASRQIGLSGRKNVFLYWFSHPCVQLSPISTSNTTWLCLLSHRTGFLGGGNNTI